MSALKPLNAGHDHDQGLAFDLNVMLRRRRLLELAGLAGAGILAGGCRLIGPPAHSEPNRTGTAEDGSVCVKAPRETSGPFPGDGTNSRRGSTVNALTQSGIVRSDIRSSFGGMTPAASGTRLDLAITLVDINKGCAPLSGHAVYIWHCDVDGKYSLYDYEDRNYLRGVGVTDANGQLDFTTIFPGCYPGRWPHIHFEVLENLDAAVSGDNSLLISQFAMPAEAASKLYRASATYKTSISNFDRTELSDDNVFGDNTPEQISAQTIEMTGDSASQLVGTVTIGMERNA